MDKFKVGDVGKVRFVVNQILRSGRLELKSADGCVFVQEPSAVEFVGRPIPPRPTTRCIIKTGTGEGEMYLLNVPGRERLVDIFDGDNQVTWQWVTMRGEFEVYEKKEQ